MRLITRHSQEFDIFGENDPALSPFVRVFDGYVEHLRNLHKMLGVDAALWTFPFDEPLPVVEFVKPVEYLLEVADDRIIAFIDECSWTEHLQNPIESFKYSLTPTRYRMTSVLVKVPISKTEVLERCLLKGGRGRQVVERIVFPR